MATGEDQPRVCCIVVCRNARPGSANPAAGYHRFPADDANLRRLWIAFVGPANRERFRWRGKYICSEHFQAAEIIDRDGVKVLLEDSVPTIFAVDDDDDDEDDDEEELERKDVKPVEPKVETEVPVIVVRTEALPSDAMELVEEVELRNLFCRICLGKHHNGMVPLSSKLRDRFLLEMIYEVTGLEITSDGIAPNQICPGCVTKIDLAYNVREEFLQREQILRDMMAGSQLERYYNTYAGSPVELVNQSYLSGLIAAAEAEVKTEEKKPKFEVLNVQTIVPAPVATVLPIEETIISEVPLSMEEEHLYEVDEVEDEEIISIVDDSSVGGLPEEGDDDDDEIDSQYTNAESITSDSDTDMDKVVRQKPEEDKVVKPVGKVEPSLKASSVTVLTIPPPIVEKPKIDQPSTSHQFRPTMMDPRSCHICFTHHTDLGSLEAHLNSHAGMLPYQCERCSADGSAQQIETIAALNEHVGRHQFPFQCGFCDKRFSGEQVLFEHMRALHDNEPEPESGFTCTTCGQQFAKRALFRHHMTRHEALEDERFKCQDCGRVFGSALLLRLHRKIHTGEWKGFVSSRAVPYGILSRKQH